MILFLMLRKSWPKSTENEVMLALRAGNNPQVGRSTERKFSKSETQSNLSKENLSVRSLPVRRPSSRASSQKDKTEWRPNTVANVGKSYTNRCVKEILHKIERGAYASEWYNFSNPTLPAPKWIDFHAEGHGGVLDAFLCQQSNKNQMCYMMDVRLGDKVGRLLKYPENIRVGQNGKDMVRIEKEEREEKDENDKIVWSDNDEHIAKCREKKIRPFPLSWKEQFSWENVKIITTPEKDPRKEKRTTPENLSHQPKRYEHKRKDFQQRKQGGRAGHGYSLRPVDIRIIQSMPNVTTRQKSIRGFRLENSCKTSLDGYYSSSGGSSNESITVRDNHENQQKKKRSNIYNYLSVDGKSIRKLTDKPVKQKCRDKEKTEKRSRSKEENGKTVPIKQTNKLQASNHKGLTEKLPSRCGSLESEENSSFRQYDKSEHHGTETTRKSPELLQQKIIGNKPKFDVRIPFLKINPNTDEMKKETENENPEKQLTKVTESNKGQMLRSSTTTNAIPLNREDSQSHIDYDAKALGIEAEERVNGDVFQEKLQREGSSKEQLLALRKSITQSVSTENMELEKDLQLLHVNNHKHASKSQSSFLS
ncbi:uncharacterized protein LOC135694736 isoform X2 [Rhopilema esculentum]|uniref:uncharacterized protein LOC135694736 isoform X2 n=1 Tax=Rhopilema esculentum TaxID=499914 RepID=UPI0031D13544